MEFRIAETFTDSLARLTGEQQKAAKNTAFDLQLNPANPGLSFHKLDKARDKNFWSVRVSADIRLIVHRTSGSLLLCYVDHHDRAYDWAERRKLQIHPNTGAAQFVEIREIVQEILIPTYVEAPATPPIKKLLFTELSDDELLGYGVPSEWLKDVRGATEDTLLTLADHLPAEAAEALLELATGGKPRASKPLQIAADPFDHPDAQRRFRVMSNIEELQRALEYPWDKWTIFLHPEQRQLVEREFNGPARVSGSAGTGKTIVALHRAAFLARSHPDARVLLTTFSEPLANALRIQLRRLLGTEPRLAERLEIHSLNVIARRLFELNIGKPNIATVEQIQRALEVASVAVDGNASRLRFLMSEWEDVVDAWQLKTWEVYRDVARLGRKTRLPERQRESLWRVFEAARSTLRSKGLITPAEMLGDLSAHFNSTKQKPFDFLVIDEAQDVSVAQLRFLAALGGQKPNSLFFAGDLGQRIFQQPFSWKSLGVDVRGRSSSLKVNYRTSHQIRRQADRLLGPEITDVDGVTEERRGTVSVFNGPEPVIEIAPSAEAEAEIIGKWLSKRHSEGVLPHEIAIFVRSQTELPRARAAAEKAGVPSKILDESMEPTSAFVSISTMHFAKGLEFRAVAVMACDDEIIPLQERIESVVDDSDLEEVYNTERHLLYVACTRARDHLLITGIQPGSEFLDDLRN